MRLSLPQKISLLMEDPNALSHIRGIPSIPEQHVGSLEGVTSSGLASEGSTALRGCSATSCLHNKNMGCDLESIEIDNSGRCSQFVLREDNNGQENTGIDQSFVNQAAAQTESNWSASDVNPYSL